MKFIKIGLYVLQFIYSAIPELVEFIQKAVEKAKEFLDGLKEQGLDEPGVAIAKADAREKIIAEAKAQFPNIPESIMRIALEAEVYKHKGEEKEGSQEIELAKQTYPQLWGKR